MYETINADKIGISTNIVDNPMSVDSTVATLGRKFKTIEVEFENESRNLLTLNDKMRRRIVENVLIEKTMNNVYISCHAPYLSRDMDLLSPDEDVRAETVDTLARCIDLTAEMEAELLTFHPGFLDKEASREEMLDRLYSAIYNLKQYADEKGVTLCLENTGNERPNYFVITDQEHIALCKSLGINLTLDLTHFTTLNDFGDEYFLRLEKLLPYVRNMHIADLNMPKHIHLPLGKGNFPYETVVTFVYENGYTGNIIVEERGARHKSYEYISASLNYKKRLETCH